MASSSTKLTSVRPTGVEVRVCEQIIWGRVYAEDFEKRALLMDAVKYRVIDCTNAAVHASVDLEGIQEKIENTKNAISAQIEALPEGDLKRELAFRWHANLIDSVFKLLEPVTKTETLP